MKIVQQLTLMLCFTVALSTTGCANRNMENGQSGFLGNYEDIADHEQFTGTRVAITPGIDFTQYDNIYIAPIKVISPIPEDEQSDQQKQLYTDIATYLTAGYKEAIQTVTRYTVVDSPDHPKTLLFEGAISAVEVHGEDITPMEMMPMMLIFYPITRAVSDANVRILGEGRLTDTTTGTVVIRMVRLSKGAKMTKDEDQLVFTDVQTALDDWLADTTANLVKLRKGIIQAQTKP